MTGRPTGRMGHDSIGNQKQSNGGTCTETLTVGETYGGSDRRRDRDTLVLDGTPYPPLYRKAIPPGYGEVDVQLIDNSESFECAMVAGSVGARVLCDDTVQPVVRWWLFVEDEVELVKKEMEKKS
ncbi:hypothetical protein DFH06DRAFT_1143446 [Mycena polygramma]|nr:hypothetical protein DFH06DRAFT_1143446 [Mycena polygramma]